MSVTTAEPRTIAGKIVSAINRRACPKCRRPLEDGVLTFGLSGSDPRWYPDEQSARREIVGVRYLYPLDGTPVTLDSILAWLEQQREEIELMVEHLEQQREERRMHRLEREDNAGFRTDPWACVDCGYLKHRPADRCDRCGDEPCPIGIDPHDYNRGYGYRD